MRLQKIISKRTLTRKLATIFLLTLSVGAFATLGDGRKKGQKPQTSVLLPYSSKNFSLRTNYTYRSSLFAIQPEKKQFLTLNTMVTYQKGNATFIVPLKKMALMGRVKFVTISKP